MDMAQPTLTWHGLVWYVLTCVDLPESTGGDAAAAAAPAAPGAELMSGKKNN